MVPSDASDQLRLAGLRVTASHQSVPRWLAEHPHAMAEEIRFGVARCLGSVSTQTVYDVLAACTTAELVRHIEPTGHPARFERRVGDNSAAAAVSDDDDEKKPTHYEEAR